MNMTEIGEYDWKVDCDERYHGELDRKYNKYYHNNEHEPGEFDQKLKI